MTDKYVEQYENIRPSLIRFTKKLETLIHDILSEDNISIHLIESRTKEASSFRNKITRSNKSYKDPINEITDLCGIRIIAYYEDEVEKIENIIRSEFSVDEKNSLIHSNSGAEFGYRSSHFIININQKRAQLKEWNYFSNFTAEIQVRTVLQHAWAAISHKLQYKQEADVPQILKRKLFRLSALFELADDEFISLRDASTELKNTVEKQIGDGNLNLPLDITSIAGILSTSQYSQAILDCAKSVGFTLGNIYSDDHEDGTYGDLLLIAHQAGYKTVSEFSNFLEESIEWCEAYLKTQLVASGGAWTVDLPFICQLLIFCKNKDKFKKSDLIKYRYNIEVADRVIRIAESFNL